MKKLYAKRDKTIEEHTEELLKNLNLLKKTYGKEIETLAGKEVWELLRLSALYHDLGKASEGFQNKIRRVRGERVKRGDYPDIPHNFLSTLFLVSGTAYELALKDSVLWEILFFAVAFHHDRELRELTLEALLKSYEDLSKKFAYLDRFLKKYGVKLQVLEGESLKKRLENLLVYITEIKSQKAKKRKERFGDRYKLSVFVKGLLHRLDHASSAGVEVEKEKLKDKTKLLELYLKKKEDFNGFKPFQLKGIQLSDQNVILVAPTGSGKTEFALNWTQDGKTFYTLPVKTAVNAMWKRLSEVFGKEKVGLLHGERALSLLEEEDSSLEEKLYRINLSSQLSMPVTVATADQLFTSSFKYPGYEKVYATLAYSKVVIDEPQGYSPETLAPIVQAVKEVSELGGKFCIMSATLFPFLEEELKRYGFKVLKNEELYEKAETKHRLFVADTEIDGLIFYAEKAIKEGRKVLMVVNTVRKAQELYKNLKEASLPVKLLHSLFIKRDRQRLELEIKEDSESGKPIIWITTQVAEASLDVDFDLLITEASTLDSLVQRMGRVYRKRGRKDPKEPNVLIASLNSDKGKVYNSGLVELALESLKKFSGELLKESEKLSLVEEVYSPKTLETSLKAKKFLNVFRENLKLLEVGVQADTKGEAQSYFRNVQNVSVIPERVFKENREYLEGLISEVEDRRVPFERKLKAYSLLKSFTVDVPVFRLEKYGIVEISKKKDFLLAVGMEYNPELGVPVVSERELLAYEGLTDEFI
jgi:CRISPR-associated endonuclease/helicase Cas3